MLVLHPSENHSIVTLSNDELKIIKQIFDDLYFVGKENSSYIVSQNTIQSTELGDVFLKMKREFLNIDFL